MIHSDEFHDGAGFDFHVRTTIQDYFSYIESGAFRLGEDTLELYHNEFYVNGVKLVPNDLPYAFGDFYISDGGKNDKFRQFYIVNLAGKAEVEVKFYKKFMTYKLQGNHNFLGSVGLVGEYPSGEMIDRSGGYMTNFQENAFEWQVSPSDFQIFRDQRSPQLPYEVCRMPTAPRPSRRNLRADMALLTQAQEACAHISGADNSLCVDDVMTTGDVGIASVW